MANHPADWPLPDFTRLRNCAGDGSPVPRSTPDPKGPMMTTISDQDRADAQAMAETLIAHTDDDVRRGLAVRDHVLAVHECPSLPVWRPTTRDEIQLGWEVRSRYSGGMEATWGVAHKRGAGGDWLTEWDRLLTWDDMGWTCETTAPLSAPDPRIAVVMEWYGSTTADHAGIADLLARLDNLKVVEYSEPHSN